MSFSLRIKFGHDRKEVNMSYLLHEVRRKYFFNVVNTVGILSYVMNKDMIFRTRH